MHHLYSLLPFSVITNTFILSYKYYICDYFITKKRSNFFSIGGFLMVKNVDNLNGNKFEGEPRAKPEFASKRANGTINTHPQERMQASSHRETNK